MPKRLKVVGWYDPLQLARTVVEVAVSTIFGRRGRQRVGGCRLKSQTGFAGATLIDES